MPTRLLAFLTLVASCTCHMQMTWPYPFKSASNPANNYQNIDYSMTSPLATDGSDYPCKNYHTSLSSTPISDTLTPGRPYTIRLGGSASHMGGSCQISMSYDGGDSFAVIHSIIGGCPLTPSYTFDVPNDLPAASQVLLAWSWQNRAGNREMVGQPSMDTNR